MKKLPFVLVCFLLLLLTWNMVLAQKATVTLPDLVAPRWSTVSVPITVTTDSSINVAQFVVEYNTDVLSLDAVKLGDDVSYGFSISDLDTDLPYGPSFPGTNDNLLVQVSGGVTEFFSGVDQEIIVLDFEVIGTDGSKSPLVFDEDPTRTYLTTVNLTDIVAPDLEFENGSLLVGNPPEVRFFATPTSGYPPLIVKFQDKSSGDPVSWLWDFGDGQTSTEKNPTHGYYVPGEYGVTLTITTALGQFSLKKKEFIDVWGYGALDHAPLQLVDNSSAFVSEGWDNSIDEDISGWNGTTSTASAPPFAIYAFKDGTKKSIDKVKLHTHTDVKGHGWVEDFSVYVSTTGLADSDFSLVLQDTKKKTKSGWQSFSFVETEAKYIKFVIDTPISGWRRLGEFRVCPVRPDVDAAMSSVTATSPHFGNGVDMSELTITVKDGDGDPITGLTSEDFYLYILNANAITGDVVETGTPGVYKTMLGHLGSNQVKVEVMVHGVMIDRVFIEFSAGNVIDAPLVLLEHSDAHIKEGWDNAIDGVVNGWRGTVTAMGASPYAIFGFSDGSIKSLHKARLLVDTDVGHAHRWVRRFRIQVSTTGMADADFATVYQGVQEKPKWQGHSFPAVNAKYVKLILDSPESGYRQLGEVEFKVGEPLLAKNASPTISLADDEPLMAIPNEFSIKDNYPNPFNPETTIEFGLPSEENVTILIFNQIGQLIRTLYENPLSAGYHTITWNGQTDNGEAAPSGVYFLRFSAGEFSSTQKMMMVK